MEQKSGLNESQFRYLVQSRKKLVIVLLGASITCALLTFFTPISGDRVFYSNLLAITSSGSALALSLHVIYRQKLNGILPRLYVSLGVGLALWFIAEATWAYYEIVAGMETPFPSVADAFWLAGYVPVFYFLYGIVKHFLGIPRTALLPVVLISSFGFVFLANMIISVSPTADLATQDGILSFIVSSAYPIADMFLIVLASAAFMQLRKGQLTFTPWAFIVIAVFAFIVADIGFGYFVMVDELADMVWLWYPLYNAGDVAIACSLLWHRRFFTVDEKKQTKEWQEKNR